MARKGRYGIYRAIILKNNVVAPVNYTLIVDTGFYTLTGEDVTLNVAKNITVDTGFYTLTGEDIGLNVGKSIVVDTGLYVLTGEDVSFNISGNISVDTGFYSLTGNDVSFVYTPINVRPSSSDIGGSSGGIGSINKLSMVEDERKRNIDDNDLISVFKIFLEQCQ